MPKVKSQIEDEPESCFTSMIDIVFLLLIFFILQPFKQPEKKLRSELPKDLGPSTTVEDRVSIRLQVRRVQGQPKKAYFMVNSIRVDNGDRLFMALNDAAKDDKEVPVTLSPAAKVHFMHVLKALDQCYLAELTKVAFDAPPPRGN